MIGIYLCDDEDAVRHQIQTALEWKIFTDDPIRSGSFTM